MPILTINNRHVSCRTYIQDYLARDKKDKTKERALGWDYVNLYTAEEQRDWAERMDRTRAENGNDRPWRGRPAVTFYHIVVSPDPRDALDLETLRAFTMDWVEEFFGTCTDGGELGSPEVAICYHEDNGVPHAHIIVNNTNLENGRRIHIDDRTNERTMPDRLQEIASGYGLRHFDNDELGKTRKKMATRRAHLTTTERALIKEGKFSWKQDIRNKVEIAWRTTFSTEDFEKELNRLGVTVEERDDGDWLYRHQKNPERWKSTGYRLGKAYTKEGIEVSIRRERKKATELDKEDIAEIQKNINEAIENATIAAEVDESVSIDDIAKTLQANMKYGIRCEADYNRRIAECRNRLKQVGEDSEDGKKTLSKINELKAARDVAEHGNFFLGVEEHPFAKQKKPANKKPASGGWEHGGFSNRRGWEPEGFSKTERSRSRSASRSSNSGNTQKSAQPQRQAPRR